MSAAVWPTNPAVFVVTDHETILRRREVIFSVHEEDLRTCLQMHNDQTTEYDHVVIHQLLLPRILSRNDDRNAQVSCHWCMSAHGDQKRIALYCFTHASASSVGGTVMPRAFAEIDNQLEFGRRHNRQVGGLAPFEDFFRVQSNLQDRNHPQKPSPAPRLLVFAATKALLCKTRLETLPNESIIRT